MKDLQTIADHGLLVVVPLIKLSLTGRTDVDVPLQGQQVEDRPTGTAGPPVGEPPDQGLVLDVKKKHRVKT